MSRFPINNDGNPRPRRITGDLDDEAGIDFGEVVRRVPQSGDPDGDGEDEVPADAEPDTVDDDAGGAELSEEAFQEQERLGSAADVPETEQAPSEAQAAPVDGRPATAGKRAKRKRGRNRASPATDETEPPDPTSAPEDAADESWRRMLQLGEKGPRANDFNAMVALEHAPELVGRIAFDVRLGALVALRPGPFGPSGKWSTANSAALTIWLQRQGIPVRVNHVETALLKLGQEHQIDPLEDYLLGLRWDGVERIGSWLEVYAGVVATPVSSLIGSKFLIGMVARAR